MLKIAVCDDMPAEIERLQNHFNRYGNENNLHIEITACSDADSILAMLEHAEEYDLLFLDIYMEQLNGIDLARQLRRQGDKSRIIFFSTSTEHALDAFGVYASQYLVKPVAYDDFARAMDAVLEQRLKEEAVIRVVSGRGMVEILLSELVYSETKQNYQHIVLSTGETEKVRITGGELFGMLEGRPNFVKLGASFIINMQYVNKVTAEEVALAGRYRVPVPRGSYASVKQRYWDFYLAKDGEQP